LPGDGDALLGGLVSTIGTAAAEVFSDRFEVDAKGSDGLDFVTSIDLAMQRRLEAALPLLLPGSRVVGEEGFTGLDTDGPVWLVDPLDGTVNFVAGLPAYSVAVVLIREGEADTAAVLDIPRNRSFSATRGGGAWLDGTRIQRPESAAKLGVLSSGLLADLADVAPDRLSGFLKAFKLRNLGSQALHLAYAAAGHLSLVASREAKAWDDLAGALIAQEAGLVYGHYGPANPPAGKNQMSLCTTPDLFDTYADYFSAVAPGGAQTS
jgi:myo-inositol-1(or 4)-monophosphatase